MKNLLLLTLIITNLNTALAFVVGDYMTEKLPEETCKITSFYNLCTGTLIGKRYLLSAKHCFKNIDPKEFTITCTKDNVDYQSKIEDIKLTEDDTFDTAVIKLKDKMPISGMSRISHLNQDVFRYKLNPKKCAVIGYGINNSKKHGTKYGVYLDEIELSKDLVSYHIGIKAQKRIEKDIKFYYELMKDSDVTSTPMYKLLEESYLNNSYLSKEKINKAYSENADEFIRFLNSKDNKLDLYTKNQVKFYASRGLTYFIRTKHNSAKTIHTSGFQPGDSGGTLACKDFQGKWYLLGIISFTKEFESVIATGAGVIYTKKATDGAVIPFTGEINDFIKNSLKSFGASSKTSLIKLK